MNLVWLQIVLFLQVPGGTMRDSFFVNGVAFKKTFSYAGFEQQPKKFVNPKILLLNIELELKSEKENAEIRLFSFYVYTIWKSDHLSYLLWSIFLFYFYPCCSRLSDPSQYQSIVDAEWNIIYDKLDKCAQSGAKVVLSRLAIGDLATQVFVFPFLSSYFTWNTSCLLNIYILFNFSMWKEFAYLYSHKKIKICKECW